MTQMVVISKISKISSDLRKCRLCYTQSVNELRSRVVGVTTYNQRRKSYGPRCLCGGFDKTHHFVPTALFVKEQRVRKNKTNRPVSNEDMKFRESLPIVVERPSE